MIEYLDLSKVITSGLLTGPKDSEMLHVYSYKIIPLSPKCSGEYNLCILRSS